VRVRSPRLNELMRSVYLGRGPLGRLVKAPIRAAVPAQARQRGLGLVQRRVVYGAPRRPDEALAKQLRARFRDEVVALSAYLGRDLVGLWGYDRID